MARLLGVLVAACVLAGCASDDAETPATAGERPSTPAQLAFVSPMPNEVTGPDITVRLDLQGGRVVERTSGELTPDEGHLHLLLDGRLVSMAYDTAQDLTDLAPGQHTLEAEFVAVDHAPFRNRAKAVVLFQVQP